MKTTILFAATACLLLSGAARAQTGTVPVQNMNFDLWCQEQQHLPPDRCDKRLPEDDAAFNAYRAKIEKYEVPYLQSRDAGQRLNRNVLQYDPVDRDNTKPDTTVTKPNSSPQ
jgi:hypothetical protein